MWREFGHQGPQYRGPVELVTPITKAWRDHDREFRSSSKRPSRRRDISNPPQGSRSRFSLFSLSGRRASRNSHVNQTCAFLNRLPAEIRIQIYKEVLGGSLFHCLPTAQGVGHLRCPGVHRPESRCFRNPQSLDPYYHTRLRNTRVYLSSANMGFLRTCRQIYVEAIDLLYSANTFDFANPVTFLWFAQTIPPQRLASITKLQITWNASLKDLCRPQNGSTKRKRPAKFEDRDVTAHWDPMWNIIANDMPGLKSLWVQCRYYSVQNHQKDKQELLLVPMLQLRGLKDFHFDFKPTDFIGRGTADLSSLIKRIEELAVSDRDE